MVKKEVIKKTVYDKSVKNVNAIQADDSSYLVKKDCNTNIAEIEKKIFDCDHNNKYILTREFNKLKVEIFTARLKQAI